MSDVDSITPAAHHPTSGASAGAVSRLHPAHAVGATLLFALGAIVWSWPLVFDLDRDVPWDLGDSLLNCWILGWDAHHMQAALSGQVSALRGFWHGNIFHPNPYALGYSELLLAQAVQILPIYALTNNLLLAYNLLFLSTFVLCGLGMYLLVRELTGDWRAALVAGSLFAFAPYRAAQATHIQILSAQWMPFVLYGLRRFFVTARWSTAAWTGVALLALNLSCGYYMIFFALFLPFYVLYELGRRGQMLALRPWLGIATTVVIAAVGTLPTMYPYLALRALVDSKRSLGEIDFYSADAMAYLTAPVESHVWGTWLRAFDRPEGQFFPGLLMIVLVVAASVFAWRRSTPSSAAVSPDPPIDRRIVAALWTMVVVTLTGATCVVFGIIDEIGVPPLTLRFRSVWRLVAVAAVAWGFLLKYSPRARAFRKGTAQGLLAFSIFAAIAAAWISLGPQPRSFGRNLAIPSIYPWLLAVVPGFDGLRVAARLGVLTTLFLSVAAGYGAAGWLALVRRPLVWLAVLVALPLLESAPFPIPTNSSWAEFAQYSAPPARVNPGSNPPPIYRAVAKLPSDAVLVEFPFGDGGWELRAVYYSTMHWRRIVNGYSGVFPASYLLRRTVLGAAPENEAAWPQLLADGVTHVLVHERGFPDGRGQRLREWLEAHGATVVAKTGPDSLYQLPVRELGGGAQTSYGFGVRTP